MLNNKINSDKNLKEATMEVVAFFDLFSFPLTINEILKYLKIKSDYLAVLDEVESLVKADILNTKEGLYFLLSKDRYVEERKRRYNYSDRKFKIALKVSRFFRFVPWTRMIAVANLIGRDNLRNEGDIDIFIISDKNRLWLTRFFSVLIAKFLNLRPQKNNSKDKICLSFFVSEEGMDLAKIKSGEGDKYFDYWLLNLAPVYSRDKIFEKFMHANKKITENYPNYFFQEISYRRKIKNLENTFYKNIWELIFGGLEKNIKKFQLKIMPRALKRLIPENKGVIVSDKVLKLHLSDRREEFMQKYNKNISRIHNETKKKI